MQVSLRITRAEGQPGHFLVVVSGEGFFGQVGKKVGARIRGDDPVSDDSLFSIGVPGINRVLSDGTLILSQVVPSSRLNEDWGQDEIYALVDVEGAGSFRTNTVKGNF